MWSATVGATPVYRWTCAASAIFSYGSRGTPAWANTLNRVPELPNAHEGSSMRWPRSVSVTPVAGWARVCMAAGLRKLRGGDHPTAFIWFQARSGHFGYAEPPPRRAAPAAASVRRAATADVVHRARGERDLVRGEPRHQCRQLRR